jgi:hypothetical protein
MTAARFLLVLLAGVAATAGAIAALTMEIDPYLIFDSPRRPGLDAAKPAVQSHEPLMKAYQSLRVRARTVILGSSRVDIGLDPASAAWPRALRPVYNLGLIGGDTPSGLRLLQAMIDGQRQGDAPEVLVVGLDFEFFLTRPPAGVQAPAAPLDLPDSPPADQGQRVAALVDDRASLGGTAARWRDALAGTLSLEAITDSLATVYANRDASAQTDLEADGHYSEGQYRHEIDRVGVAALFARQDAGTLRQYRCPVRRFERTLPGAGGSLEAVQRLLVLARTRRMKVYLAIAPSHAQHLDLLEQLGYWHDLEDWKRALVGLAAQAVADGTDVQLWDFAGYEPYTTERVPPPGDRSSRLRWFWDSVHSSSALGDLMLARLFEEPGAPPDFGARLTPASIEERLARVRRDRQDYREREPNALLPTRRMLAAAAPCAAGN